MLGFAHMGREGESGKSALRAMKLWGNVAVLVAEEFVCGFRV